MCVLISKLPRVLSSVDAQHHALRRLCFLTGQALSRRFSLLGRPRFYATSESCKVANDTHGSIPPVRGCIYVLACNIYIYHMIFYGIYISRLRLLVDQPAREKDMGQLNILKVATALLLTALTTANTQKTPCDYVNPLIGTVNGGHVFPGATLPFGMAKAVADVSGEDQGGFASDNSDITGELLIIDSFNANRASNQASVICMIVVPEG